MSVLSRLAVSASTLPLDVKKFFRGLLLVNTAAAAGTDQTDATALTAGKNLVTAADGAKGVILPVAEPDMEVRVVNTVAGSDLLVYPNTGAQINALTATTGAFTLPGGTDAVFYCDVALHWYVRAGTASSIQDLTTGITAFSTGGQASATALTSEYNNVTTCLAAGDSVKLPAAAAGKRVTVKNSGATSLAVFPATDDSINALAANLSVNIPVGGEVTFNAISAVVWETVEVFVSSAPTTQKGEFVFKASDNGGDHEVILTNASHGQATTHTHPDGGAATDYVVHSTAAVTLVEADVLDGATQGAGVASKAVVLDSSGNFGMADGDLFKFSADTLAAAGTTAIDAAVLIDQMTVVTGANGAAGVALPAAADLGQFTVINDSPTYAVKVYPVSAGDDVINDLASDEAFILGPGRSVTLKAISATQWYADKNAAEPTAETHFTIWDDFTDAALDATNRWLAFDGADGDADIATTVAGVPEGQISMGSGDGNIGGDMSVMSLLLVSKGALVSLGKTVFEARVAFSGITGISWGFGLGDVLANATEVANYTVDSGVVADDGGIANAVSFVFSTDATTAEWQACSTNGGTVGNSAAEEALGVLPAVNTYQTLRIEVDASGDARFYVNGVLEATRATAVATTALLIPYIWGDSGTDAQVVTDVAIDYIKFSGARPSSNA